MGKAEHCIFLWLGGGMAQVDTFDPKLVGVNKGTPKKAGSLYNSIDTCVRGVKVCEHLSKTANLMDRVTVIRTINHKVVDEHAFATNLVHTGRMVSGNVTYPSVGSIVSHERGAENARKEEGPGGAELDGHGGAELSTRGRWAARPT